MKLEDAELVDRTYASSGGTEHFISFESPDRKTIYAFVRLYLPGNSKQAFVRELHTYGEMIPVGSEKKAVQHTGFGKRLMAETEKVAEANGFKKLAVIAGIGVKEYYRKLGYRDENTYVVKTLEK